MRVLVISLLRLGDFIQNVPVINGLKSQNEIRELDVLTHESVRALAPMLPGVKRWWTIDRDKLQMGLGQAEIPLLTSFALLQERLNAIDATNYDLIINLTQTEFSAWVAGYLQARERLGLTRESNGQMRFHSPWFQYLNEHSEVAVDDVFHHTDIFHYGCGLNNVKRDWSLETTPRGREEVRTLPFHTAREKIVVQALTSDVKKNWSENAWLEALTQLQLFRPQATLILLGAPNEQDRLEGLQEKARARRVALHLAILSIEGAFALLRDAQLLITGDTSIKHLANCADIPILELSLGSSDFRRTGAYRSNSLILQPRVACAPCRHSVPCSQGSHRCAEELAPGLVSTAAHHLIEGQWSEIKKLAEDSSTEVRWLRTRWTSSGFWLACDLAGQSAEQLLENLLLRCTWKFLLNREHLRPLAEYGSESFKIKTELQELASLDEATPLLGCLRKMEARADRQTEQARHLLETVERRKPALEQIAGFIRAHRPQSTALNWLEKMQPGSAKVVEGVSDIGGLRRLRTELESFRDASQVQMKLVRSLQTQLMESK